MKSLKEANIGDSFKVIGFNLCENDIKALENVGIKKDTIIVIKDIIPILNNNSVVVLGNNLNLAINHNYAKNIYGEVLEKSKQFVKTR